MEKFIGVKVIKAEPMTRQEYNDYRNWTLPADENGDDPGMLKDDGEGHIQWDPQETFDRDFFPANGPQSSRENSLAVTKMEEAVFWIIRGKEVG